jgi:drug/metabolite transporter (DMT)-like permease
MGLIEPLIAVVLGAFFLDERLTVRTAIGGLLILLSVGVVLSDGHRHAPAGGASAGTLD